MISGGFDLYEGIKNGDWLTAVKGGADRYQPAPSETPFGWRQLGTNDPEGHRDGPAPGP